MPAILIGFTAVAAREREISLPLSLSLLLSFARLACCTRRAADESAAFCVRAARIRFSAGSKLTTANRRRDLSIPIDRRSADRRCRYTSRRFPGVSRPPRRSTVALPLRYSTNRFHARSASVTLPGREHCGSDAPPRLARTVRGCTRFRARSSGVSPRRPAVTTKLVAARSRNFPHNRAKGGKSPGERP